MLRMFVARVVVRLAVRTDLQDLVEYESFNQFGLGTSSGIDTAYHSVLEHHRAAVRVFMADPEMPKDEQPVLVKYDFKWAFPSIFRDVACSSLIGHALLGGKGGKWLLVLLAGS